MAFQVKTFPFFQTYGNILAICAFGLHILQSFFHRMHGGFVYYFWKQKNRVALCNRVWYVSALTCAAQKHILLYRIMNTLANFCIQQTFDNFSRCEYFSFSCHLNRVTEDHIAMETILFTWDQLFFVVFEVMSNITRQIWRDSFNSM